jgi:hypothetical protein
MQPYDSTPRRIAPLADERGIALIVSLMIMLLLTALGLALTTTTLTETKISSNYATGVEALYAADAAVERVMQDILTVPNWNRILDGTLQSSFIDGPPNGVRTLPDGSRLDLTQATNMLRCGKPAGCSDADLVELTDDRPWGPNNPRWQLYAYGPMNEMIPTDTVNSMMYVIVWAADDPSENDANPLMDGGTPVAAAATGVNDGRGVMMLIAQAYGPGGTSRIIEVTVGTTNTTEIERGYTGQRGQDEQNRRARKAAIGTPGKALDRRQMLLASGGFTQ